MRENRISIETASPDDLASVVDMLDKEFVYQKGRILSFASRFPGVYSLDNLANIYVVKEGGRVVSALTVKHIKWLEERDIFELAMVGGVCTKVEVRRRGLASAILAEVETSLRQAGVDFVVLWTTIPSFYAKLGWRLSDCGLFGTLRARPPRVGTSRVSYSQLVPADVPRLEAIREQWLVCRVIRQVTDYQTIPIPAETVERFVFENGFEWIAYAIVGRLDDTAYVYEVLGDPKWYSPLWTAILETYRTIYINDCTDSGSRKWLDAHADVQWNPQNLAMWQVLSSGLAVGRVGQMCISFLDRI